MEGSNYREVFGKNCYETSVCNMIHRTDEALCNQDSIAKATFLDPLRAFIGRLLKYQESNPDEQAKYVCISFLRSAMYLGKLVLLVEAYMAAPFLEPPLLSCEMDAAWLFPCWEDYQKDIKEKIRQQALGRYIREPELKSYDSKAISVMLRYFALYLRYLVREMESYAEWAGLEQRKEFMLSYGEYMDWQFPLCVIRGEIDPFLCDGKEEMTFRRFRNMHYKDKEFPDFIMDDCLFQGCAFVNTTFKGTKLRGVRFIDCIFEGCCFQEAELAGSSILSSRMKNTVFHGCSLLAGLYKQKKALLSYPAVTFRWSLLEAVRWEETPTEDSLFVHCQIFDET